MRKTLKTKLTTCMLLAGAVGLSGCEGKSAEQISGEKLESLLEKMDRLDYAAAPVPENQLVYTNGTTVNGVDLPGSDSFDAAYIDQALVLLPLAQEVVKDGNTQQKKAANTIIASILADEGSYLTNEAERAFQKASSQISFLRERADMVKAILAHNGALAGDRTVVIDTLKTGDIGNGGTVDGVDQLSAQVAAAGKIASETGSKLAETLKTIGELREEVLEYEALDLKLTNESDSATAQARFAKLEKATVAMKEGLVTEAKADALATDAEVLESKKTLADSKKALSQKVIDELEAKIAKIRAERQTVADKLAQLEADRKTALTSLANAYNELDAMMQAGAFDRMAQASDRFGKANDALTAASLGSRGDIRLMSLYTLHARSLQQQAVAARTYAAMLGTLTAAGPDVLGAGLHQAISERIGQMAELESSVKQSAATLEESASLIVPSVSQDADSETAEGQATAKLVQLYVSYRETVGAGGIDFTPPPAGGSDDGSGAGADLTPGKPADLIGKWEFKVTEIEGQALPQPIVTVITFKADGGFEASMGGPDGEALTMTGTYTADDSGKLVTKVADEFGGEESGTFGFKGDTLVLIKDVEEGEPEDIIKLTRVE